MTRFASFALLYMTAIVLEFAEKWRYPGFTAALIVFLICCAVAGTNRVGLFVFLATTTAHFMLVQLPDVANHVNVIVYCNLMLMLGITYSLVRIREYPSDEGFFEMARPVLQVTLILVYALAGFAKLNADFLNPSVSCVGSLVADLTAVARSNEFRVPAILVLVAGVGVASPGLVAARPGRPTPLVAAGAVGLALIAAQFVLQLLPALPASITTHAVLAMAIMVLLWELVGGPLLAVSRLQAPILAFSWMMHSTLALIGFVDFGALALTLLLTFVPAPHFARMGGVVLVPLLRRRMHRLQVYVGLCLLSGVSSGLHQNLLAGALFDLGALVLVWPILAALATRQGPSWQGVALTCRRTPKWMFVFPLVVALHGLTSYLGLRTAGNFTMFSNLRTEGPRSNHLLLGSNPLKLWGYQEDVVRFIRINDRKAKIGYQYQPLRRNELPVVEFRKLIYAWTAAGITVPMTLEYRGQVHSTENIVTDPAWRTGSRDWEMRLLDFRVIQAGGPNRCRW
jgi:hypothetical protein